jgi:hypothetical protein
LTGVEVFVFLGVGQDHTLACMNVPSLLFF